MAETSPAKGFVAGGFGGVCLVLTGHPLDTMKVTFLPHSGLHHLATPTCNKCLTTEGIPQGSGYTQRVMQS